MPSIAGTLPVVGVAQAGRDVADQAVAVGPAACAWPLAPPAPGKVLAVAPACINERMFTTGSSLTTP